MDADIDFNFDPVCPFAWMTSKWVRQVRKQRDYTVDWRFISLRLINARVDYDAHFPPEYEAGHTAGLRLLRVAARTRAEHGREAVAPLYAAFGTHIFDTAPGPHDQQTEGEVRYEKGTLNRDEHRCTFLPVGPWRGYPRPHPYLCRTCCQRHEPGN